METVTIKPDMRVIHPEYGDITEDVARELAAIRQEDHKQLVKHADRMQAEISSARSGTAVLHRNFALKAQIHPAIYAHWRMKHGKGFWKHEMDWFLKKNPQCRVRSKPLNSSVVVPDLSALPVRSGPITRKGRWST